MRIDNATTFTAASATDATSALPIDGRRQRSHSSRAKIVKALLDLVEGGTISPSAAEVAETAGVGLRSVFRHFDDMDSLYREMSDGIEAKVLPMMLKPLEATDWKGRIRELTERRVSVFEAILPFRISASIKRHQSEFLMQSYKRMLRVERQGVEALLPEAVLADPAQANAVLAPLSFQTWRLLRHDQELPVAMARQVVLRLVEAVLAQCAD